MGCSCSHANCYKEVHFKIILAFKGERDGCQYELPYLVYLPGIFTGTLNFG